MSLAVMLTCMTAPGKQTASTCVNHHTYDHAESDTRGAPRTTTRMSRRPTASHTIGQNMWGAFAVTICGLPQRTASRRAHVRTRDAQRRDVRTPHIALKRRHTYARIARTRVLLSRALVGGRQNRYAQRYCAQSAFSQWGVAAFEKSKAPTSPSS